MTKTAYVLAKKLKFLRCISRITSKIPFIGNAVILACEMQSIVLTYYAKVAYPEMNAENLVYDFTDMVVFDMMDEWAEYRKRGESYIVHGKNK
jgi:hypothetical protein